MPTSYDYTYHHTKTCNYAGYADAMGVNSRGQFGPIFYYLKESQEITQVNTIPSCPSQRWLTDLVDVRQPDGRFLLTTVDVNANLKTESLSTSTEKKAKTWECKKKWVPGQETDL